MRPPALASWILRVTLPAEDRDDILENLEQLHAAKAADRGRLHAQLWFWRQALSFPLRVRTSSALSNIHRQAAGPWLQSAASDLRLGLRTFRTAPLFAAGVVLTLALGLGANVAVFAVVHAVLLRPLPYPEAEALHWLWPAGEVSLTHQRFLELDRAVADEAVALTAFASRSYSVEGGQESRIVQGAAVTWDFTDVLASAPQLGRGLREGDGLPGAERVALISDDLWRSDFGADSTLIGRTVEVHTAASIPMIPGAFTGARHTIVGVLPPGYEPFGYRADVVTALVRDPSDPHFANMGELSVLARSTLESASVRQQVVRAARDLPSFERLREDMERGSIVTLRDALRGSLRPTLLLALAAVSVVLLMACVNVANLTLTRSRRRRQELAVRMALGAGRARVIRQLLTESLLLSTVAGIVALLGAGLLLGPLLRRVPGDLLPPTEVPVDGNVLAFTIAMVLGAAVLSGIMPALAAGRRAMEREGRSPSKAGGRHRLSRILAATQVALTLVLAQAAVLLVLSFERLQRVDPGLNPRDVVTIRVAPSEQRYAAVEERRALISRALEQARALPGVQSAGAIHFLPIADGGPGINFLMDASDPDSRQAAGYRVVTPGYLETLRIPVRQGRTFNRDDAGGAEPVGIVNERLASLLWPEGGALGRTVYRTSGDPFFTVVGVVGDVRQWGVQQDPQPEIYIPLDQSAWASAMSLVVRTGRPAPEVHAQLREVIRDLDEHLPITRMSTMVDVIEGSLSTPRFLRLLFMVFAGLALTLGGVGVYGVVATIVADRTDEIGIRMALGASSGAVLRQELREGSRTVLIGIALGMVLWRVTHTFLEGMVFDVPTGSWTVAIACALFLGALALLAVAAPAARAGTVDPRRAISTGT